MAYLIYILLLIPVDVFADPVSALIAAIATTAGSYATGTVVAGALAKVFIASFVSTLVLTGASKVLAPKPKKQSSSNSGSQSVDTSQTIMIRDPVASRNIIYGKTRSSGVIVYGQVITDEIHIIMALAGHEIASYENVYFNDEEVSIDGSGNATFPEKYVGKVKVYFRTGADNQSVMQELVDASNVDGVDGKWTSEHTLSGIAYIYAVLKSDNTAFPSGIPNISALVTGKPLYDTRTATTAYSDNPALVLYDYLTNTRYGLGISASEIDTTAFNACANACEVTVTDSQGNSERTYECHGVLTTANSYSKNIESILSSMFGTFFYSGGVFSVKAGVYQIPTITLTQDDFISDLVIQTRNSKRDSANGIKGIFTPVSTNYIASDYPSVVSSTFISEDDGEENIMDFPLSMTSSATMAQRIARIALYRGREQLSISVTCNLNNAFKLQVGDSVTVIKDNLGFDVNSIFQVAQWSFDVSEGNLSVSLVLRQISSAVYDYELADEKIFTTNNTNLFIVSNLQAPGISVTEELRDYNQQVLTAIIVTLSTSTYFINNYEVQIKRNIDTDFINLGISNGQIFEYLNAEDLTIYNIRARAVGSFGQISEWATASISIAGKSAPPSDVTNFSVNVIGDVALLAWTPVSDLDLSHYTIRHSVATSAGAYSSSRTIVEKVSRPANQVIVPALTGTYFIKAIDKLGLESKLSAQTIAIINKLENDAGGYDVATTITESPSFLGTLDDVAIVDSQIVLDTTTLFDSTTGDFDDLGGYFDGGGGYVDNEGYYYFYNKIDLVNKYTVRLSQNMEIERLDYVNLFDDASGNFDDRQGNFDGDSLESGATDAILQLAITNDDPASGLATWTEYRDFIRGDYTGRGFKFKLTLKSSDANASPSIDLLSIVAQLPYNYINGQDIASGTAAGGFTVTYPTPFYLTKAVAITAQNLATGDYFEIVSKSGSNFVVRFKNSANTVVDRTFDYTVSGLGQLVA
jgi:hypothetical protein